MAERNGRLPDFFDVRGHLVHSPKAGRVIGGVLENWTGDESSGVPNESFESQVDYKKNGALPGNCIPEEFAPAITNLSKILPD